MCFREGNTRAQHAQRERNGTVCAPYFSAAG
jgi:hypothetical protein